jgi:hypothetical protein
MGLPRQSEARAYPAGLFGVYRQHVTAPQPIEVTNGEPTQGLATASGTPPLLSGDLARPIGEGLAQENYLRLTEIHQPWIVKSNKTPIMISVARIGCID